MAADVWLSCRSTPSMYHVSYSQTPIERITPVWGMPIIMAEGKVKKAGGCLLQLWHSTGIGHVICPQAAGNHITLL